MLVNTDNRIIAGAVRSKMEPIVAEWISHVQHGFLSGRSMIANPVDVQHAAQMVTLRNDKGAILLLDFKAAFPSLNHKYMHSVLKALGLPESILETIRMMYHQHGCNILFDGQSFEGFPIDAGIRQGCPLSPLIFSLVVDVLLRRIQRLVPSCTTRAFADDIALVLEDVERDMPILRKIFYEFSQVSNLDLNMPKCVLIPLWCEELSKQKDFINERLPEWSNIEVNTKGTYLGFVIGPEGHLTNWDKATSKYLQRTQEWADLGLGMLHSAAAYAIYVLPVLTFLAQLSNPPEEVYEAEKIAIAKLLPGPTKWCELEDAFHLSDQFGQHKAFPSLKHTTMAAQRRVLQYENRLQGGLGIAGKAVEIHRTIRESDFALRKARWQAWYDLGPTSTLKRNKEELDKMGLTGAVLLAKAGMPDDFTERTAQKRMAVQKKFQKTTRDAILQCTKPDHERRLRHKLDVFNLPGNKRTTVLHCLGILRDLKRLVPPRVSAAVLRTMFNGWTTEHRFQKISQCKLGCCGFTDTDSIEHYSECPTVIRFARTFLNLSAQEHEPGLGNFVTLGGCYGTEMDSTLVLRAILVYATYRTSDLYRRKGPTDRSTAIQAMQQFAKDAVRGHNAAQSHLRHSFIRDGRRTYISGSRYEDLLEEAEDA